jgi:hypothetical protein
VWNEFIGGRVGGGVTEGIRPWASLAEIVGDVEERALGETEQLDFEAAEDFAFAFSGLDEGAGEFRVEWRCRGLECESRGVKQAENEECERGLRRVLHGK